MPVRVARRRQVEGVGHVADRFHAQEIGAGRGVHHQMRKGRIGPQGQLAPVVPMQRGAPFPLRQIGIAALGRLAQLTHMRDLAARGQAALIGRPQPARMQRHAPRREVRMDAEAEGHGRIAAIAHDQCQAQAAGIQPIALHAFERPGPTHRPGRRVQHQVDRVGLQRPHLPRQVQAAAVDGLGPPRQRAQPMARAVEGEDAVADAVGIRRQRIRAGARPFGRRPVRLGQRHDPVQPVRGQAGQASARCGREFGRVAGAGDAHALAGIQFVSSLGKSGMKGSGGGSVPPRQ